MKPLMAESEEELKSLLLRVKEESEKTGFKLNIQHSLGSKVTAAMKLKDPCSLEEKLWQN